MKTSLRSQLVDALAASRLNEGRDNSTDIGEYLT